MAQRNAAGMIWPHLPTGERAERQQSGPSVADAMWPTLAPKALRRLSPNELREAWHEYQWSLSGIRRIK